MDTGTGRFRQPEEDKMDLVAGDRRRLPPELACPTAMTFLRLYLIFPRQPLISIFH